MSVRVYVGPPMDRPPTPADLKRMQLLDITTAHPLQHREPSDSEHRWVMDRLREQLAAKEDEQRRFVALFRRSGAR